MDTDRWRRLLSAVSDAPGRAERITHLEVIGAREARTADWPDWLAPDLTDRWRETGIARPWTHQAAAAIAAHDGEHVVLSTGTASGKSLAYLMPAVQAITDSRGPKGQRGATALYLTPTKALAQDQAAALRSLAVPGLRVATHDGDSTAEERAWSREHAEYLLTNPDMLHHSMLPEHERWGGFFSALRYVIVDECHHYRGVFGAHVAQVLRRLRRVAAAHGADPTFVLASATVAEPALAAGRLTGLPVRAITEDGSPRGRLAVLLWQPPFLTGEGLLGTPVRRSVTAELADLVTDLTLADARTLAFVRSRRGVEAVAVNARRLLAEVDPVLADRVAAYRGGYLPEERRRLEADLRSGRVRAMAATNALELGIDVSGLDAVLLGGFPGTRAAFWQQLGRAGRGGADAVGILVARDDPLDTYLVTHPESLLGAPVEATVFDPENPYVLGPHLCAAAAELPLTEDGPGDVALFGPTARAAAEALTEAGYLRRRRHGWYWTDRSRPSDLADLRSSGGAAIRLVEAATGRVLGTMERSSAPSAAHPGAVYLHQGESYLVQELDLEENLALLTAGEVDYTTHARQHTDIEVLGEHRATDWGPARISFGPVRVTHQVVSYLRRAIPGGEVIAEYPLDLPEQILETTAVWWTLAEAELEDAGLTAADLPGAAHAAEHASIGLLPLFATCDRWDLGGVSTARHPDTGRLTVFVHDGHPGGAGFAERGFEVAEEWLTATRDAIAACRCREGCPSCVQSPKCGNGNHPLDKAAAVRLLGVLLGGVPRP